LTLPFASWADALCKFRPSCGGIEINNKGKIKGNCGGQECPRHKAFYSVDSAHFAVTGKCRFVV
jgi:hypothetical protein